MNNFFQKFWLRGITALLSIAFNLTLAAQTASTPPVATRVITLGTQGGPLPVSHRAQPANAVVVGDRIYLVDAGNGVMQQLARAGLDYRRIGQIFITHNHDDHNADWGTLMGFQLTAGRSQPVTVYGPYGTESMLKGFLQYYQPNDRIRRADARIASSAVSLLHAHDITSNGLVYADELVKVTAVEVCHYHFDAATRPEMAQDKSFAFRFQTPDKVIVFSGDTGACPALVEFARDADLLIHEVINLELIADSLHKFMGPQAKPDFFNAVMRHMAEDHTTPEDIGKLATAAHVKKVVLSHFTPGRDTDPDSAYVDGVKKFYAGPVVAAKDLMEF
jgi:ribonuclease BN (tRNA processing enzyme)